MDRTCSVFATMATLWVALSLATCAIAAEPPALKPRAPARPAVSKLQGGKTATKSPDIVPPANPFRPDCTTQIDLLPDGTVVAKYPDNTTVSYFPAGGFEVISADGEKQLFLPHTIPPTPPPPSPPDAASKAWLLSVETRLLGQIKSLVGDNAAVDSYLVTEPRIARTTYEKIDKRLGLIERLTSKR